MQIKYNYGNERKVFMAISLGERNGKLVCLLDNSIPAADANKMRKSAELLSKYPIESKIAWIKSNTPDAYKGYREIFLSRLQILKQFPLKHL